MRTRGTAEIERHASRWVDRGGKQLRDEASAIKTGDWGEDEHKRFLEVRKVNFFLEGGGRGVRKVIAAFIWGAGAGPHESLAFSGVLLGGMFCVLH